MNRLTYTRPTFWATLAYLTAMLYFGLFALYDAHGFVNVSATFVVAVCGGMVASTALSGEGWGKNCWVQLLAGSVLSTAIAALLAGLSHMVLSTWPHMGVVLLTTDPLMLVLASLRSHTVLLGPPLQAPMARVAPYNSDEDTY